MQGSSIHLLEHDSVTIKPIYKHAVPTAYEVKIFFDAFHDFTAEKIGLGLIAIEMLRCVEVPPMRWTWLTVAEDRVQKLRHFVYKPSNRRTKLGTNYYFKEALKPCYSKWLSDQIMGYSRNAPSYRGNKLFPWTTEDGLQKCIVLLRKKIKNKELSPEYDCFLEQMGTVVYGATKANYRISLYSLRRFAITFHYWVTYKQDIIALSSIVGHTNPKTTLEHYVKPKEAIGLTQEMIDSNITIDEFIHLRGKKQMQLPDFSPEQKPRFLPVGQRTLSDFTLEANSREP